MHKDSRRFRWKAYTIFCLGAVIFAEPRKSKATRVEDGDLDPNDGLIDAKAQSQLNWVDVAVVHAPAGVTSALLRITFTMTNVFALLNRYVDSNCYSHFNANVIPPSNKPPATVTFQDTCSQGGLNSTNTQMLTVDTSLPDPTISISEVSTVVGAGNNEISASQDSGAHITIQSLTPGVTV